MASNRVIDVWVRRVAKRIRDGLLKMRLDTSGRTNLRAVIKDVQELDTTALENAVADARAEIGREARAMGWDETAKQLEGRVTERVLGQSINVAANPDAVAVLERAGAQRVAELSATSRDALRTVLADMVAENVPPSEMVGTIKSFVGLTARDAERVLRARATWIEELGYERGAARAAGGS